jgi:hypothetical protein
MYSVPYTVVLKIGLTGTHSLFLFWPHRQDLSADSFIALATLS